MAGGNAVIKQLSHPIMKNHSHVARHVATMKGGRRRRSRSASAKRSARRTRTRRASRK
jgi:hypothetical protein